LSTIFCPFVWGERVNLRQADAPLFQKRHPLR